MKTVRVLLVDDHTLVRAGIRSLLEHLPAIHVVAEAGNGREALRMIRTRLPDVVLMDLSMPGLNGLDALRQTTKLFPRVRVLIVSMHASEEYVWQALSAGAAGYLLKGAEVVELELAITAVANGVTYLSPPISKQVITSYLQRAGGEENPYARLTPRQREVLQLIAEGQTTRQIARTLNVSVKTVETHRAQLMERLGVTDLAGLIRYAIKSGMVELD